MPVATSEARHAFDVWRSYSGHWTARPADKAIVDDSDAPYGFHTHEIRLLARNRREALTLARAKP